MQEPVRRVRMRVQPGDARKTWISALVYCAVCFPVLYYAIFVWRSVEAILISAFFAAFGVVYLWLAVRTSMGDSASDQARGLADAVAQINAPHSAAPHGSALHGSALHGSAPHASASHVPAARAQPDGSPIWLLVAANLVPVAGVAFWGWRVHDIVFLYWIENLVIGFFNFLRVLTGEYQVTSTRTAAGNTQAIGKGAMALFFVAHYGIFCIAQGDFLSYFFPDAATGGTRRLGSIIWSALREPHSLVAILAIGGGHAYSYFHHYIGGREYLNADFKELMVRPYKRILVTQVFLLLGGLLVLKIGSPVMVMVLFVAAKTACDAHFHRRERVAIAAAAVPGVPGAI